MVLEIRNSGETVTVSSKRESVRVVARRSRVTAKSGVLFGGTPYSGSYEATPSDEAQVIPLAGLTMADDLTINPIPSNYGRIAWDGSKITVY